MFAFDRKFTLIDSIWVPLQTAPLWAGLYLAITVVIALAPSVQVLAIANFIEAVGTAGGAVGGLLYPALILLLSMALQMVLTPLRGFIEIRLQMKLRTKLRVAYLEKLSRIEYAHMESPKVWDTINRLTLDFEKTTVYMEEKFFNMFQRMVRFVQVVVGILGIVTVLSAQIWWMGILMVGITVPMMFLSYKLGGKNYDRSESYKKHMRASSNLGEVLLFRQYTFERFLFGFVPMLNKKWAQNYEFIKKNIIEIETKSAAAMKAGGILSTLMAIILILIMSFFVTTGKISVAVFIPLVTALFNLSQTLSWELADCLYWVARIKGYFADLSVFSLLSEIDDEESRDKGFDPGAFNTLEFRNVKFRYPGTETYVLNGVSFLIEKGKHYAFVGINGAGKTTVTKLIAGLYKEYEGDILINGLDMRKASVKWRKKFFAAVFQDFAKYQISLEDNIKLGNPKATEAEIENAVDTVGLKSALNGLPDGIKTTLGKIKNGGVDVSGGEWQRIAMARAVVSPAEVKILDEPTAALDPISESRVYERFGAISRDATTVFISHRLGSTQLADVIFVLENGRISEEGSHDDLMEKGKAYFAMYDSQRSWYI